MTAVPLIPPRVWFPNAEGTGGNALGLVYFYAAGTDTPKDTYTNAGAGTPNTNPVVLDAAGTASIWGTGSYKVVNKTAAGVTISTIDNYTAFATGASSSFADDVFSITDNSDATKVLMFQTSGITTGTTTVLTVPNGNATLATVAGTQTLTNKTLTSPAFTGTGGPGWIHIKTVTANGDATIDFVNGVSSVVFDGTYKNYVVVLADVKPSSDNVNLLFRTSANTGSSYNAGASDYDYAGFTADSSAIANNYNANEVAVICALNSGSDTGETLSGIVRIYNPAGTTALKLFDFDLTVIKNDGTISKQTTSGTRKAVSAIDAFRFLFGSGNVASGTFTLYGLRSP